MDELTCHYIDRLITVEMRAGRGNVPRGVTQPLYDAARAVQGDRSLTFLAAEGLRKAITPGDHVLIVTGAGLPPWLPEGETDGPPGAAALARALALGLGARPVVISEERHVRPVIAAVEAVGLAVLEEELFAQRTDCARVITMPLGPEAGAAFVDSVFAHYKPSAVIFVEKLGPNAEGYYNSVLGTGREPTLLANAEKLADRAAADGIFSLGVADGGNEIGCGLIIETVQRVQPFGGVSRRPDGSQGVGMATVTKTDVLTIGAVSNWGAYGVVAALAALQGDIGLIHSPAEEARMLSATVAAGAADGLICRPVELVDGVAGDVQPAIITMLRELVRNSLDEVKRGF